MSELSTNLPAPGRALAVAAHSDDAEFGCGATLAKWAAAGTETHLLVLTDGSKGTWDPSTEARELVETRHAEQHDAAKVLGIAGVHFLGLVDGELRNAAEEQAAVCEIIRSLRPDVVLGHDPWKRYRLHPDHRHAGFLLIDAIVAARDPHFFPGRGEPHRPERMLLFEAEVVDHVEDVTGFVDTLVDALLRHRSQWRSTMEIDAGSPDEEAQTEAFATRIRTVAAVAGEPAGVAFGEAFKLVEPL